MWPLLLLACTGPPPDGEQVYEYDNVGVACIRTTSGNEVVVDFGDCLFCSTNELSCTVSESGGRIDVTASGRVVVEPTCSTGGTCESTEARCDAPDLDGTFTLAYAGAEVQVTLPSPDFVRTGPSGVP